MDRLRRASHQLFDDEYDRTSRLPSIVEVGLATLAVTASGSGLVISAAVEPPERSTGGGGRYSEVWRPEFYEPFRTRPVPQPISDSGAVRFGFDGFGFDEIVGRPRRQRDENELLLLAEAA